MFSVVSGCTAYLRPGVEAGEVGHRRWDISEVAGINRLGFDRAEVGLDPWVVIRRAWPVEELVDAELLEVLARGAPQGGEIPMGAHLGAAVTQRLGPLIGRQIKPAFVD